MSFALYIVYVRNVSRDIWHVFNKILFSFRARLCVVSPILVLAALPGLVLFELFKRSTLCLPCQIHILLSLLLVLLLVAVVLFLLLLLFVLFVLLLLLLLLLLLVLLFVVSAFFKLLLAQGQIVTGAVAMWLKSQCLFVLLNGGTQQLLFLLFFILSLPLQSSG